MSTVEFAPASAASRASNWAVREFVRNFGLRCGLWRFEVFD